MTDKPDEPQHLTKALAAVANSHGYLAEELRRLAMTLPDPSRMLLLTAAEYLEHGRKSGLH